jgi:hypothetical protein
MKFQRTRKRGDKLMWHERILGGGGGGGMKRKEWVTGNTLRLYFQHTWYH